MAFIKREISLTFTKGAGTGVFATTGTNQVTYEGLRVQCDIAQSSNLTFGQAQLRIYGLTLPQMQEISALNRYFMSLLPVELTVWASDDQGVMNLIFDGQVMLSQIDMNGQPDSAIIIVAQAGILTALQVDAPATYPGAVSHLDVLESLAAQAGLAWNPNGRAVTLNSPYLPGSIRDKIIRCATMADVNWTIALNTLTVWPHYGTINGTPGKLYTGRVPLVSPETGLVGYPTYSANSGITVKSIFNPQLQIAGMANVQSQLQFANGTWQIFNIHHDLESQMPNGRWFTRFDGQPLPELSHGN
jgi:hypothetical protein